MKWSKNHNQQKNQIFIFLGYAKCGGCPGVDVEYVPEDMKNNGAEAVHFAMAFIVGYQSWPTRKPDHYMINTKL